MQLQLGSLKRNLGSGTADSGLDSYVTNAYRQHGSYKEDSERSGGDLETNDSTLHGFRFQALQSAVHAFRTEEELQSHPTSGIRATKGTLHKIEHRSKPFIPPNQIIMSANDNFSLHDDEELSLHDDASLDGSVPATNKGDAPAKPPQIITTNTLSNIKLPVLQNHICIHVYWSPKFLWIYLKDISRPSKPFENGEGLPAWHLYSWVWFHWISFDYRVPLGFGRIACSLDHVNPVIRLPIEHGISKNPREPHWNAVKNILKYLRNTEDMFLVYGGNPEAELRVDCYYDAGFKTDRDDVKFQT
ncbi:hypothetical protein Tco_0115639 [Tanacetum coccineum]